MGIQYNCKKEHCDKAVKMMCLYDTLLTVIDGSRPYMQHLILKYFLNHYQIIKSFVIYQPKS